MSRLRMDKEVHVLSVTQECNNFCIMCYEPHVFNDRPTLEELYRELQSLDECREIYLTGGEPTLRPDLHKLVLFIRKRFPGVAVNLITNGRRCSYLPYATLLKRSGIRRVITELFSDKEEVHDRVTQSPGSFRETRKGMRNLMSVGLDVEIRIPLTKPMLSTLPDLSALLVRDFPDLVRVVIHPIMIWGFAQKNLMAVVPTFRESRPHVENAASRLSGMNLSFFHYPYCVISERFWPSIEGVTTADDRVREADSCTLCSKRDVCPKIWKTYIHHFGQEEFIPVP